MTINKKFMKDQLRKLLEIPSPTGYTQEIVAYLEKILAPYNVHLKRTRKDALLVTMPGKNNDQHKLLTAHVDTLGAMVKEIKGNGTLKLTQLGGYPWNAVEGEYCTIHTDQGSYRGTILLSTPSSHVHGAKVKTTERSEDTMVVRIDATTSSKEDTEKLGIEVGDFVSFDPRVEMLENGYIKSRHLDDKASVAVLLGVIDHFVKTKELPAHTTHFLFSNYEEVGHGAASAIPPQVVEMVAVDMAAPGEGQASDEKKVTICAKDSSGPFDFKLRKLLVKLAKKEDIDYVLDIYPYYGSDVSAALHAGADIRHGLIGPGVDASHSFERTHEKGILNSTKLAISYLHQEVL